MLPYKGRNGWLWYPTEFILQNTWDSIDGYTEEMEDGWDWNVIINAVTADTGFMHLVRSIQKHGWKSAVGWDNGRITEGHHRLAAGILLYEPLIPTTPDGTEWKKRTGGRVTYQENERHPDPLIFEDASWK